MRRGYGEFERGNWALRIELRRRVVAAAHRSVTAPDGGLHRTRGGAPGRCA
jgi:hypothetical protein